MSESSTDSRAAVPAQGASFTEWVRDLRPGYGKLYLYPYLMHGESDPALEALRGGLAAAWASRETRLRETVPMFVFRSVRERVIAEIRFSEVEQKGGRVPTAQEIRRHVASRDGDWPLHHIKGLLQLLPIEEREAFVLAVVLEYTPEVASRLSDTPAPILRTRLKRAYTRLAQYIADSTP